MNSKRFSESSVEDINNIIIESACKNTKISSASIWKQFQLFCDERGYKLEEKTSTTKLAVILKDYGFNMKKQNGEDYKEAVIKTMWNKTAKLMQELYYGQFNRKFDPFNDIEFKSARDAKNTKRKLLQKEPEKRKQSSASLSKGEILDIIKLYDENTPSGLQKKFYHIASYELAWRGGEGSQCLVHYFKDETNNAGLTTTRIEYNPIFSKTAQGGAKRCADSKWLIPHTENPDICPVRLLNKLLSKRNASIKTDRLFLTVNIAWDKPYSSGWYKNMPIGVNMMSKWMKESAEMIGLDIKKIKITNHSARSTAVSHLAKAGINELEIIKLTGHSSSNSLKPYLKLDNEHHSNLIDNLRESGEASLTFNTSEQNNVEKSSTQGHNIYNNCIFHVQNFNAS